MVDTALTVEVPAADGVGSGRRSYVRIVDVHAEEFRPRSGSRGGLVTSVPKNINLKRWLPRDAGGPLTQPLQSQLWKTRSSRKLILLSGEARCSP